MKTLGRNASNDLYLEAGNLAILKDADAQCVIIESIIQTQQGELQFDENAGIDYFGTVFQNPNYIPLWAAQVRTKISALDFVSSVEDFEYRFDRATSTLYWSMTVVNTDDDRLELKKKKTVIGTPSTVDVNWNNIYDKPTDVDQVIEMVGAMEAEAARFEELKPSDNQGKVKEVINSVVFDPNDENYINSRLIKFVFSGVPLGTVIDLYNLKLTSASTVDVVFSDGYAFNISSDGGEVVVPPEESKHVLDVGGTVTMTLRGDITAIEPKDSTSQLPIFLSSANTPFPYLVGVSVGSRVSVTGIKFTVGSNTFRGFKNIMSIDWQSELPTTFGEYAFADCQSISNLNWLPKNLTSIGEGCFIGCSSLLDISGLGKIHSLISAIPAYCFASCTSLKSLKSMPSSITSLGAYSFSGCKGLTDLGLDNLNAALTELPEGCFSGCTGLTSILYWPSNIKKIGTRCFYGDTSLASVYLPESLSRTDPEPTIESQAFADCTALSSIMTAADTPPKIADDAFNQSTETLYIYCPPGSVNYYQESAGWNTYAPNIIGYGIYSFTMEGIPSLTEFIAECGTLSSDSIWTINYGDETNEQRFINTVTDIPAHRFPHSESLLNPTIVIKGYIKTISAASSTAYPIFATAAGQEFPYLTSFSISAAPLEFIGDYTFARNTNLNTITLDDSVSSGYHLGQRTFAECSSLQNINWLTDKLGQLQTPESTEANPIYYDAFGEGCFYQAGLTSLNVNILNGIRSLPAYCFAGTKLSNLENIGNENLNSIGEYCFSGITTLQKLSGLELCTNVTELPAFCFTGSMTADNITASLAGIDNITTLGERCFANCTKLADISALEDSSITTLPNYCFSGCRSLATLIGEKDDETKNGVKNVVSLGIGCFQNCYALEDLSALHDSAIVDIPDYCFEGCTELTSLIGLDKIQTIGTASFLRCTNLTTTAGLGSPNANTGPLSSIGHLAFSRCSKLTDVSIPCVVVPALESDGFDDSTYGRATLYVRAGMEYLYASETTSWGKFSQILSRSISITLSNLPALIILDGEYSNITSNSVWYIDYGDGTEIVTKNNSDADVHIDDHQYANSGTYTLTLFGDITGIASNTEQRPILTMSLAAYVTAAVIDTDQISTIGQYAFYGYNSLSSLTLNTTGNCTIGLSCFEGCSSMNITSGDRCQITNVGSKAFSGCTSLTSCKAFAKATTIGEGAFSGCTALTTLEGLEKATNITTLSKNTFNGCSSLSSLEYLPPNLTTIGEDCFANCTQITKFTKTVNDTEVSILPPRCKTLSKGAFYKSGITSLVGLYSDTTLGEAVFKGCNGLTSLTGMPISITEVPKQCFEDCVNLASWGLGAGYRWSTVGDSCFKECTSLTTLDGMPWSTGTGGDNQILGDSCFEGCTSLTSLIGMCYTTHSLGKLCFAGCGLTSLAGICSEIVTLGEGCFSNCTALSSLAGITIQSEEGTTIQSKYVPGMDGMTTITALPDKCFSGCTSLQSLQGFPTTAPVKSLGVQCFADCIDLTSIVDQSTSTGLPLGVETIGALCFGGCTSIAYIKVLRSESTGTGIGITNINDTEDNPAFAYSTLNSDPDFKIYVPNSALEVYKAAAGWSKFDASHFMGY